MFSNLCNLLSRRKSTRYTAGSNALAILVSKLALDAIGFDPLVSEGARAALDATSISDNRNAVAMLLGRIHDNALGLLQVVYADNRLIASTLLLDMLPLLLETYVSSPLVHAGQKTGKTAYQSHYNIDNIPIPLAFIALISLMQASLAPGSHAAGNNERATTDEDKFLLGTRLIASFVSSLFKVIATVFIIFLI
jgi:hypothetical protein